AFVTAEPARDDAVLFHRQAFFPRKAFFPRQAFFPRHALRHTDTDDPQSEMPRVIVGGGGRGEATATVDDETPSDAAGSIDQLSSRLCPHPWLWEQRAVRGMRGSGQQSALQRRHDILPGDGAGFSVAFGKDAGIARFGCDRIALADDMADCLDPRGELTDMRAALLGVTVEQRRAGLAPQHPIEFPDQIGDIANALTHALA